MAATIYPSAQAYARNAARASAIAHAATARMYALPAKTEEERAAKLKRIRSIARRAFVTAYASAIAEYYDLMLGVPLGTRPSTAGGSELAEDEHRDGPAKPAAKP